MIREYKEREIKLKIKKFEKKEKKIYLKEEIYWCTM